MLARRWSVTGCSPGGPGTGSLDAGEFSMTRLAWLMSLAPAPPDRWLGAPGREGDPTREMSRTTAPLTPEHLDALAGAGPAAPAVPCVRCVFWELDPVRRQRAGDPAAQKRAWLERLATAR